MVPDSASVPVSSSLYAPVSDSPTTKPKTQAIINDSSTSAHTKASGDNVKIQLDETKIIPRLTASAIVIPAKKASIETRTLENESDSSVTLAGHTPEKRHFVNATQPHLDDVLLGRGEDVTKHTGNVLFQKLVMDRKREYLAATPNDRETLAREIKGDVDARQGRFLKRIEGSGVWVPIDSKAAMKKIKQSFLYTYNTDTSLRDKTYYQSIAVKEFTENDVLLGRGRRTINNIGNIRFREIISDRKPDYAATSIHSEKDRIARDVKTVVENRHGRFLEKLEGMEDVWVPVDEAVVLKKIKLCFRYHHAETSGERGLVMYPPIGNGAGNASLVEAAKKLSQIHMLTNRQPEAHVSTVKEHESQKKVPDALHPHVLTSADVEWVGKLIHTTDLRPNDVLLGRYEFFCVMSCRETP